LSDAQLAVSVIIPTLNESSNIAPTISSIRAGLLGIDHEIIIVDNGSKDDTVKLSKRFADKVFVDESLTIGGLRNLGVENSSGSILIFNDADVLITDAWRREFDLLRETLKQLKVLKVLVVCLNVGLNQFYIRSLYLMWHMWVLGICC
jgi:glycosyltransferase involved in cell wall biosynthesis